MQQTVQPQLDALRVDSATLMDAVKVLQESVGSISTKVDAMCASGDKLIKMDCGQHVGSREFLEVSMEMKERKPRRQPIINYKQRRKSSGSSGAFKSLNEKDVGEWQEDAPKLAINDFRIGMSAAQA